MARNATNPLATALDKRIRAIVEEAVEEAVREEVKAALREELASILGSISGAEEAVSTRAAARTTTTKARATAKKATAARGRARASAASEGQTKCGVADCTRPYRSRGYCAAHYQAARKYGWPMPPPEGFVPPPRPSRGRPPKA